VAQGGEGGLGVITLHLHLGHLEDAFIQSDLERVHLLKTAIDSNISLWYIKIGIELFSSIHSYEANFTFNNNSIHSIHEYQNVNFKCIT